MNNKEITDHSLYLLVDGQLDQVSELKLKKEISDSPELQKKLKRIYELKELVGLAYVQELPKHTENNKRITILNPSFYITLAASLFLALGVTLGWIAHQQYAPYLYAVVNIETLSKKYETVQPSGLSIDKDARKYMMHFDTLNETRLSKVLIETNSILQSYADSGLPVTVDLLFDQESVYLFKPIHSAELTRLKEFIGEHENIQFYACSESLKMFLGDMDIPDDVKMFHTNRIVKEMIPERMEQGWVYIKA